MAASSPRVLVIDRGPDLAEQVRAAAEWCEPVPAVESSPDLSGLADVARAAPVDAIVVGPSFVDRRGLRGLAALHHLAPTASVVLAVAQRPDASLRDIVRAGADDLLALPVDENELALVLERAMRLARRRWTPTLPDAHAAGDEVPARAPVITVVSPTGGCGKSFVATNTALFLTRRTGRRVILVDLDLQFGEVSIALRLRAGFTIADLLRGNDAERDFEDHLSEFLVEHELGFSVLAAPKDPAEADAISPADVTRILEALRDRADYVVVDTPGALNETVLAALDLSDYLIVMGTPEPPSVRNVRVYLDTIRRLGIPPEQVSLVFNKAHDETGAPRLGRLLSHRIDGVLPYAPEASRSVNLGVPLLALDAKADITRQLTAALTEALSTLLPDGAGTSRAGDRRAGRRNWRDRLSPLARIRTGARRQDARQPVEAGEAAQAVTSQPAPGLGDTPTRVPPLPLPACLEPPSPARPGNGSPRDDEKISRSSADPVADVRGNKVTRPCPERRTTASPQGPARCQHRPVPTSGWPWPGGGATRPGCSGAARLQRVRCDDEAVARAPPRPHRAGRSPPAADPHTGARPALQGPPQALGLPPRAGRRSRTNLPRTSPD